MVKAEAKVKGEEVKYMNLFDLKYDSGQKSHNKIAQFILSRKLINSRMEPFDNIE